MDELAESATSCHCQEDQLQENIRKRWEQKQDELKSRLQTDDCSVMREIIHAIENPELSDKQFFIGGVDISFIKSNNVNACAALVVVNFPELEVVYENYQMVELTEPYIAGFLAFREADFLVDLFSRLRETQPEYLPHVLMVDGNGRLHARGFGLACHLGVLLDVPCIGVAKTLYQFDGLEKNAEHANTIKELLRKGGDTFPLVGASGTTHGMALRSHDSSTNPIYISQGHKVSLESCVTLAYSCCQFRIPEPVRKADINSREYLRVNFPDGSARLGKTATESLAVKTDSQTATESLADKMDSQTATESLADKMDSQTSTKPATAKQEDFQTSAEPTRQKTEMDNLQSSAELSTEKQENDFQTL